MRPFAISVSHDIVSTLAPRGSRTMSKVHVMCSFCATYRMAQDAPPWRPKLGTHSEGLRCYLRVLIIDAPLSRSRTATWHGARFLLASAGPQNRVIWQRQLHFQKKLQEMHGNSCLQVRLSNHELPTHTRTQATACVTSVTVTAAQADLHLHLQHQPATWCIL